MEDADLVEITNTLQLAKETRNKTRFSPIRLEKKSR